MIILIIWQGAGSGIMIFYSNLMDISQDIMESCRIDGCNEWQRFSGFFALVPAFLRIYYHHEYHMGTCNL